MATAVKSGDIKILKHVFQVLGREETLRRTLKATAKLRTFIKHEDEKQLSEKAQKLKEICISMGRPGNAWARICSILIDEDIVVKTNFDALPFVKWSCIVLKECPTKRYNPGQMLFCINSLGSGDSNNVKCIRVDGTIGDEIPLYEKDVIIPNDEEVIKEVNGIFDRLVAEGLSDEGFREEVMEK